MDENRLLKWALVIVPLAAAGLAIYPPERKLKAGIDLAGGSSLLFEIDMTGLTSAEQTGLSNRVMEVLKKRVDPNGQLNLIWRPIGNNRLEIQMPRPPREASERRERYESARAKLAELNVSRRQIEAMLNMPPDQQAVEKQGMAHDIAERAKLLDEAVAAYQAYQTARADKNFSAETTTRAAYEAALEKVIETSVNLGRLADVLALTNASEREVEMKRLRETYASEKIRAAIDDVVARYDEWSRDKGMLEDPSDLKRRIRGAGVLEFRILAERDPSSPTMTSSNEQYLREPIGKYVDQLAKRGPRWRVGDNFQWFEVADIVAYTNFDSMKEFETNRGAMSVIVEKYAGKWFCLAHAEKKFGLLRDSSQKWKLVAAVPSVDSRSGGPAVSFELDPRGGQLFGRLTAENTGRPMVILLDGICQSYATIQSTIREHGQITSQRYTQEEVNEVIAVLRAGSLPARLIETPLMEQTIGPQLGEQNRVEGVRSAVIASIAVMVFMVIYYRVGGVVANITMLMNILLTLGVMATMEATFTLPGIAGLVLTVGMSFDANVLIYERYREERERGMTLKKAVRTGYDRAFTTIFDSNLTALITCVILGYLGTEEIKGFAMTLGFGLATSMFTSLFVTKLILTTMIDRGWLTTINMLKLFDRPNVDWLSLRRYFWPVSSFMVFGSVALAVFQATTNKEALFDIEFLGGTSAQFEFKQGEQLDDQDALRLVSSLEPGSGSAALWLRDVAAPALEKASVAAGSSANTYVMSSDVLTAEQLEALLRQTVEPSVERGGFHREGDRLMIEAKVDVGAAQKLSVETLRTALATAAEGARRASSRLTSARTHTVSALDEQKGAGPAFEVITVETNRGLVEAAILAVLGNRLIVERAVSFDVVKHPTLAPSGYWAIEEDAHYLSDVTEVQGANFDVRLFKGGAAIMLDKLSPPVTIKTAERRIREIRLQPEFSRFDTRPFQLIGLTAAGNEGGEPAYSKLAYLVVDENIPYFEDPINWEQAFAKPELAALGQALSTEQSLRKVLQFAPQVATQMQQQALLAIILAFGAIVAYVWIRFGQLQYGLAAIVALVQDVVVCLGFVAMAHYLHDTAIGRLLMISDFKIDLSMVAAFLTLIGFGLNDTIVIFDRIRENRGKVTQLSASLINNSLNQCMSRTVLTSSSVFIVLLIMYVFGGAGVHGFAYCMVLGVAFSTYSTIAIAAPLLHKPRILHMIVYVLVAVGLFATFMVMVADAAGKQTLLAIGGLLIAALLAWAITVELRSTRPAAVAA